MTEKNRQLLQEEIFQLMKLKGLERGADIEVVADYIIRKEGENGYRELKKALSNFGFDLPDIKKTSSMEWIPEFMPHILLIGAFRFFDWTEEDVFNMGRDALSFSRTLKTFIKWFSSTKNTLVKAAKNWDKYYTHGEASLKRFDKNKKTGVLVIEDFRTHYLLCIYFSGLFSKILEVATGSKSVKIEEKKCVFNGDDRHEFKLSW
jgi:hypothetical protein